MRFCVGCLVGVALVLVVSAQASARHSRRVTLRVGDAFVVSGTDLGCVTQVGTHVMVGEKLVSCFTVNSKGLPPNSYVAALGADGRVAVARANAKGAIGAQVFARKPAALGSQAKQIAVHAGDQLVLAGTDLACAINNDASGVYPTCFRHTSTGGRPGSFAILVTERFVAVVQFDSTGKKTKLVFKREHGH
jgi:hypothetical protein